MNAELTMNSPSRVTQFLAVLSVATFWLLPLSPFIAMAAVSRTNNTTGWPRRISVAAAILCAVYVIVVASYLTFIYFWMPIGWA